MSAPAHKPTVAPYRIPQPEYPRNACIHQLLEATAQEHASSAAVESEGRSFTYAELHARANQLARLLQHRGVGPEVLVGVSMDRSVEMVVALLGILKAGGAYVPLDPSFGKGRIQYVLDEAKVQVLITQEPLRDSLPPTTAEHHLSGFSVECVIRAE